jgi:hypothetical protein
MDMQLAHSRLLSLQVSHFTALALKIKPLSAA